MFETQARRNPWEDSCLFVLNFVQFSSTSCRLPWWCRFSMVLQKPWCPRNALPVLATALVTPHPKAWWLSFSPQPPGILEDIAHFQTQPRRIIHWKWKCSGGADVLHCVLRHSWQIHEAGNGLPTGAGFAELPLNGPDPEEWSENQGGKGIEIRNILQRSSIAKVNWESVGAHNNTSSMHSTFWLG